MLYFVSMQNAQPTNSTSSSNMGTTTARTSTIRTTTTVPINGHNRELFSARFNFQSKLLQLKWSDQTVTKVRMTAISVPNCFYKGSFKADPESAILFTGCRNELQSIQIQSAIYGDTLGTIVKGKIEHVVGEDLTGDAVD